MKIIKLIGIGFFALLLSFFMSFFGLQVYKHTGAQDLFRAHTPYDLVIKNARIIDGTGDKVFRGEIGIRNNTITKVAKQIEEDSKSVFDAAGFTVAPNKVQWPADLDWVTRDLSTAVVRYPSNRLIFKDTTNLAWNGRSVKAVLAEKNIILDEIKEMVDMQVFVAPKLVMTDPDTIVHGFYLLTGGRGEILDKKLGIIKEGYPADLVIFNHRIIEEHELLTYLQQEKLPPIEYKIEGSEIQSTKTNS